VAEHSVIKQVLGPRVRIQQGLLAPSVVWALAGVTKWGEVSTLSGAWALSCRDSPVLGELLPVSSEAL
jgi:hypothetical protein